MAAIILCRQRVLLLFATAVILLFANSVHAQSEPEQKTFNIEKLSPYNGRRISQIEFTGLRWTRNSAARDLLSLHEGDIFEASRWLIGIHKIYDTTVLYDIETVAAADPDDSAKIRLTVEVQDRWTLLPFAVVQSGGGSSSFGVGVVEFNFLGTFAQVSGSYGTFDGIDSFDLNVFQEFFRDTDLIWGIDLSQIGTPTQLQLNDGSTAGTFTRLRSQLQLLVGRKWAESKIRFLTYIEIIHDQLTGTQSGFSVGVSPGNQYRLRPTLIFGRSELTNFLEQGEELTFAPVVANVFDRTASYAQFVMTYKKVILHGNTNYALFLNSGAMTTAEVPYLFRLGGYDTNRGFATNRAIGRLYATSSLEFRPYFFRFETELSGQVVVQGCVFQDSGVMWSANQFSRGSPQSDRLPLLSEGFGLRANFLRFSGAIVRIDAAKSVSPDEGWDISLGIGQFF